MADRSITYLISIHLFRPLQFATHHLKPSQVRSLHLDKPDGWGIYALRTVNRQIGEGADAIVEKEEG